MRDKDRLLRTAARMLPREFRERVFEPALSDIELDELVAPRPFARTVLVVECVRLGVPKYFWRKGRPTLAAVAVAVLIALGALIEMRLRYASDWDASASRAQRSSSGRHP
jgi:hypothetical protein